MALGRGVGRREGGINPLLPKKKMRHLEMQNIFCCLKLKILDIDDPNGLYFSEKGYECPRVVMKYFSDLSNKFPLMFNEEKGIF